MDEGARAAAFAAGRERLEAVAERGATATPGDLAIAPELPIVPALDPERATAAARRPVPDTAARPAMLLPARVRASDEATLDEPEKAAPWEEARTLLSDPFEPTAEWARRNWSTESRIRSLCAVKGTRAVPSRSDVEGRPRRKAVRAAAEEAEVLACRRVPWLARSGTIGRAPRMTTGALSSPVRRALGVWLATRPKLLASKYETPDCSRAFRYWLPTRMSLATLMVTGAAPL